MTQKLNEFSLTLPSTDVGPEDVAQFVAPAPSTQYADSTSVITPTNEPDETVVVGSPAVSSSQVTVYANSIQPVSIGDDGSGIAVFDVVFSVGIAPGDGTCKSYQVVKRIGIDKARIAVEVQQSTPMSIVEETKAATKPMVNESVRRARRLAGLE